MNNNPIIKRASSFNEFYNFNYKTLLENPMLNYHIIDMMEKIARHEISADFEFNVIDGELNIAVLQTDIVCLIYGNGYNEEMIQLLSDELPFSKFTRWYFAGSRNIIEKLFSINNANYKIEKLRTIYKCNQVLENFECAPGELQLADPTRIKELANLSRAFIKDWDGTIVSLEDQKVAVASWIHLNNFFQWVYKTNIVAIAQVMYEDYDFPVIGHVYTNLAFRRQGFASSIVYRITKGLLEAENDFVMLSADSNNPASNQAFKNVGYVSTGEYIRAYKNL